MRLALTVVILMIAVVSAPIDSAGRRLGCGAKVGGRPAASRAVNAAPGGRRDVTALGYCRQSTNPRANPLRTASKKQRPGYYERVAEMGGANNEERPKHHAAVFFKAGSSRSTKISAECWWCRSSAR